MDPAIRRMLSRRSVSGLGSGSGSGSLRSAARCLPDHQFSSPRGLSMVSGLSSSQRGLSISRGSRTGWLDAGTGARREGGGSSPRLPLRPGASSVKSISASMGAVPWVPTDERPIPARFQRSAVPWVPTDGRPPRALKRYLLSLGHQPGRLEDDGASAGPARNAGCSGESGGSGIMLPARLLLRLRRRVVLRAKSLCGARCSSVKQVGSSVDRAAV